MVIAMGHGIPAFERKRRRGWGFQCHKRPTGPQQISESRFIHVVNKASSEHNLRWWEERNVEARSEATLRVNERWWAKEIP